MPDLTWTCLICGTSHPIEHEGLIGTNGCWMICMGCEVAARERLLRGSFDLARAVIWRDRAVAAEKALTSAHEKLRERDRHHDRVCNVWETTCNDLQSQMAALTFHCDDLESKILALAEAVTQRRRRP